MTKTIKMVNMLDRTFNSVKKGEVVNISLELQSIYELNGFKVVEIVEKEEKQKIEKQKKKDDAEKNKKDLEEAKKKEELKKQEELEKKAQKKKDDAEKNK